MIIGGPASQLLAGRVAIILNETLALCDYKTFPDGESYTQIVTALDDEIVIIQSTPTVQELVYLLQLLDVCQGKKGSLLFSHRFISLLARPPRSAASTRGRRACR